jgi:lantibiotic modifying enzyme
MRSQLRQELTVTGGMSGVPGMAWALCRLAVLLGDDTLLADAEIIAGRLLPLAGKDKHFDIVSGSAGTIVALRALHRLRPGGPAITLIEMAARRLRETARPFGPGTGWIPAIMAETGVEVPPAGLGHGNAGVAWALAKASSLLGDNGYADLARDAIACEQTLFRPEPGSWLDVRQPDDTRMLRAWCHGSVGIGLARLAGIREVSGPDIDEQIAAALADSRAHGFGLSHAPCHGDTGATELLLVASQVLPAPELPASELPPASRGLEPRAQLRRTDLRDEAARWAGSLLDSIHARGWICGVPYGASTPSLMVGLAGIGHGLLRLAQPDSVPSVLLLDDRWGN